MRNLSAHGILTLGFVSAAILTACSPLGLLGLGPRFVSSSPPMLMGRPLPSVTPMPEPGQALQVLSLKFLGYNPVEDRTYIEAVVELPEYQAGPSGPYVPVPPLAPYSVNFSVFLEPYYDRPMPPPFPPGGLGYAVPVRTPIVAPTPEPMPGALFGGLIAGGVSAATASGEGGSSRPVNEAVQDLGGPSIEMASQTGPGTYTLLVGIPGSPGSLGQDSIVIVEGQVGQGNLISSAADFPYSEPIPSFTLPPFPIPLRPQGTPLPQPTALSTFPPTPLPSVASSSTGA